MTAHLLTALVWGVGGFGIGIAIQRGSAWLARAEELDHPSRPVDVYGPPITTALLFAVFGGVIGPQWLLLVRSLWVAVLVQVIFFDLQHRLILDRVLLPAMLVALALSPLTPGLGILSAVIAGVAAGVLFLVIALVGSLIFRAEALGFGDVKLAVFIGLILGISPLPSPTLAALFYGIVLAGVISILLVAVRVVSMRGSIAYGPYLAAGALLELLLLSAGKAQ